MTVVAASCAASTRIVGAQGLRGADDQRAQELLNALPQRGYYEIMLSLAAISAKGSTGESFNARWRSARNPLIAKLFRDVGYSDPVYDSCAPWCAVALAWCLQRDGRPLPSNPIASQSYLHYGTPVETPRLGDICIFTDVDDASIGHVGLFVGYAGADKVTVLGGNQKGDVDTRCGPGFLNSYITFEDVEINRARRMTDNGLYLRQIRRPPDRMDMTLAAQSGGQGPTLRDTPTLAKADAGRSASISTTRNSTPKIQLADLSTLIPSSADVAKGVRAVEALPPIVGQTAAGLVISALGFAAFRSAERERAAKDALSTQVLGAAKRQLDLVEKLAGAAPSTGAAYDAETHRDAVKAFALLLANTFKQVPIAKIRKSSAPEDIRRRLDDLESSAPASLESFVALSRVKLAVLRLLNHIERQSRRSPAYCALFDGEVTPALRDLLTALHVELSPDERRLVLDTPVYSRPRWIQVLTPKRRKSETAPQLA